MNRSPCHVGKDGPRGIAAFVGQIVVPHHQIGKTGLGPSRFVSAGGGRLPHEAVGPHPKFRSEAVRFGSKLTSSLQFGPFSVTYTRPVNGWNASPNMFRWPYVYVKLYQEGLL